MSPPSDRRWYHDITVAVLDAHGAPIRLPLKPRLDRFTAQPEPPTAKLRATDRVTIRFEAAPDEAHRKMADGLIAAYGPQLVFSRPMPDGMPGQLQWLCFVAVEGCDGLARSDLVMSGELLDDADRAAVQRHVATQLAYAIAPVLVERAKREPV